MVSKSVWKYAPDCVICSGNDQGSRYDIFPALYFSVQMKNIFALDD